MKPVNKLTNQELLSEIDKASDRTKLTEDVNDLGYFISLYNIRRGHHLVGIKLLYRLYKTWSKNPLKEGSFKEELSQYFKITDKKYIFLAISALNITKETYKFLLNREDINTDSKHIKFFTQFVEHYGLTENECIWIDHKSIYKVAKFYLRFNKKLPMNIPTNEFINYMKLFVPYKFTTEHFYRVSVPGSKCILDELSRIGEASAKEKSKKWNKVSRIETIFKP